MLTTKISQTVERGDIFYAYLDSIPTVGSEQYGMRPVLIIQNDTGNKYSPTVIVAMITSSITKTKIPTHVKITAKESGLTKDSIILLEQLRTIDKLRLANKIGHLNDYIMKKVDIALLISVGIISPERRYNIENKQILHNGTAQRHVLQAQ